MNKKKFAFKKAKRMLLFSLVSIIVIFNLVACGNSDSEFKKEYEASSYKKLSIYKGYSTKFSDFSNFEKGHGYFSIESENDGSNILFKGFYQMKCVHIGTQDLTEAFKTNTVKEFANLCGYKDYDNMVNNSLFQCTSNELFNYNDYVVYFEKLETGGADLYIGKRFEYTFENDGNATSVYNRVMELLSGDEYDKFDYGNVNGNLKIQYALALGLNIQDGDSVSKQNVLVGETKYTYNMYDEMEKFLFSLDKECADLYEKSKNTSNSTTPTF